MHVRGCRQFIVPLVVAHDAPERLSELLDGRINEIGERLPHPFRIPRGGEEAWELRRATTRSASTGSNVAHATLQLPCSLSL
jgi:hypothetical protein